MRILFIHHSTGGNLLRQGNVRKLLKEKKPRLELWDHGYDLYSPFPLLSKLLGHVTFHTGLTDYNGNMMGRDFNILLSNNSPKEYADIFNRKPEDPTLKEILTFDIIAFKNCFPTTKIETDEKLEEHIQFYNEVREGIKRFKNRFILFTPPPLRVEVTKPEWADRARELADYLTSEKYRLLTLSVFDFFDLLSDRVGENKNMLKRSYCNPIWLDSHPNGKANREAGEKFVNFLIKCSRNQ